MMVLSVLPDRRFLDSIIFIKNRQGYPNFKQTVRSLSGGLLTSFSFLFFFFTIFSIKMLSVQVIRGCMIKLIMVE